MISNMLKILLWISQVNALFSMLEHFKGIALIKISLWCSLLLNHGHVYTNIMRIIVIDR